MTQFTAYTTNTAPEAARPIFEGVKGAFGFVPNLPVLHGRVTGAAGRLHGTLGPVFQDDTDGS